MENRFGLKDLFLFLLLAVLIVAVVLAMKQYDRQWQLLATLSEQSRDQTRELSQIRRLLQNGVPTVGAATRQASAATGPADDPFDRIREAEAKPDYAPGDWFIDAGPNIAKLTYLVSTDVYAADVQGRVLESLAVRDPVSLKW